MAQSRADSDATYPVTETETLSEAVVETVADAEGVDPLELPPLFEAVDPDALNSLFSPGLGTGTEGVPDAEVRFSYHGYEVRVTATGRVNVTE